MWLCDRTVPVGCHICKHDRPRDPHAQTGHGGDDLQQSGNGRKPELGGLWEASGGTYGRCSVYPNEGDLLGVGQLPINKDTQLQVEQQGGAGHEGEDGVQAKLQGTQL